jgi:hypothetical protein
MKKRSIAALTLLGLFSSISPGFGQGFNVSPGSEQKPKSEPEQEFNPGSLRKIDPLLNEDKNMLNSDRCKQDFAACAKIAEAAKVAFDAYKSDGKDGRTEEKTETDWKTRLENDLKKPGAGWDKGYSNVEAVDTGKDYDAQFVIAEKRVLVSTDKEDPTKNQYKTYYLIGIRGTQGRNDLTTDSQAGSDEYSEGKTVHHGFNGYTKAIKETDAYKNLVEKIRASEKNGEVYEVLATGHSLGGASATLIKAALEDALPDSASKISAITFGAPPVGNEKFADSYGNRVTAIIADGDVIPGAGINAYLVGTIYKFEDPDKTEKRKGGTTRSFLDKALDVFHLYEHNTYSKRDRYDPSVENGWYDLRNDLMHNYLTGITQGGSSHIGSAAYFIGNSSNNDRINTNDEIISAGGFSEVSILSAQKRAEYTAPGSIVNLTAPVDILINWNQSVAKGQLDLDSHLTGPTSLGVDSPVRFHTYFSSLGSSTQAPFVELYKDVIPKNGGSGPEQTRIQVLQDGVYRFYVHDYTNKNDGSSPALSQSEAQVNVYQAVQGSTPNAQENKDPIKNIGQLNVPTDGRGNIWYVFQLDSRTGILKRVSAPFGNESIPSQVPRIGESVPQATGAGK